MREPSRVPNPSLLYVCWEVAEVLLIVIHNKVLIVDYI